MHLRTRLRLNLVDFYSGKDRAVACVAARVLATTNLADRDLFALGGADDFGGHAGAVESRFSYLKTLVAADRQDLFKRQLVAGRDVTKVDVQLLAFFNLKLFSTISNNRIHRRLLPDFYDLLVGISNSLGRRGIPRVGRSLFQVALHSSRFDPPRRGTPAGCRP
jgi:hypothetical protein